MARRIKKRGNEETEDSDEKERKGAREDKGDEWKGKRKRCRHRREREAGGGEGV